MSRRRLYSQLSSFDRGLRKERQEIAGMLGIPLGGERVVEVATRNSYVYVRLRESQNEVIQAFNDQVAPVYDLPVLVTREGGKYKVLGRDTERYGDWGSSSAYLPKHGDTHSRNPYVSSGGDVVWVFSNQFMPWLTQPSGTNGAGNVVINGEAYLQSDGTWRYDGISGSPNLLSYKPTGSNNAVMVLIYENMDTGVRGYSVGSEFPSTITGTAGIIPYLPTLPDTSLTPLAAVRLVSGTRSILWNNIYDLRQWIGGRGGGGSTGTSFNIYDEGVLQGAATSLDFVGAGVDATISGTRARISIPSGGGTLTGTFNLTYEDVTSQFISGSPVNHFDLTGTVQLGTDRLYYNGVRQQRTTHYVMDVDGQGFTTNFTGAFGDVMLMDYGSALAGGGGGSTGTSIAIQDEGIPQGNVTTFNFVGSGVIATVSGTVVNVNVSGGTSTGSSAGGRTLITGSYPGGTGSVSFNIPSGYNKIEIEMMARTTSAVSTSIALYLDVNGDTNAANYYHEEFYARNDTQFTTHGDNSTNTMGYISGNPAPTDGYGWLQIEFPYYDVGTFQKMSMWHFAFRVTGSSVMQGQGATVWKNTNKITSMIMRPSDGNFMTGTVINIYGLL